MRKRLVRRRVVGVAVGLVAGWWAAGAMTSQAMAASAVEGTWAVTVSPEGTETKGKGQKVTLVFKPAEFSVKEWEKQGYKGAGYETDDRRFGPCKFEGTLENEKTGEKSKWVGVANSGQLTGNLTVTKKNGDEVKYTFQGERTAK
jgi:hypothetical protein